MRSISCASCISFASSLVLPAIRSGWLFRSGKHTASRLTLACLPLLLAIAAASAAWGADSDDETASENAARVSYFQEVRPILQAACHGCHQPAKSEGAYVMTDFDRMLAGGETGDAAIVPGKPDESYLLDLITPVDGWAEMPQERDPLAEHEVALIRRWIAEGATNDTPANAQTTIDQAHPPRYEANPVITSLDYSPDGKWLAVAAYHEVLLYETANYSLAARLVGLSERIESVVFSPDSKQLAVAGGSPGRKGELQIWDVEAHQLARSHNEGFDTLYGASWSSDGRYVAFGCPDNTLRAIDAVTGEQVLFNGAHNDWVLDTVFSLKDDHLVSVSRDRSMKLIAVQTQRFVDNITSITPGALKGGLNTIDRHPSRDELLTGGADGIPKLYRMFRKKARKIGDDFNLIRAFPAMSGRLYDVRFSQDGSLVVAGSSYNGQGQIRVYQTEDAKQLLDLQLAEGGVFTVDLTPDASHLAAAGFDGVVRVYDRASGELHTSFAPLDIARQVSTTASE